jgi:L-ascorbate metabolism protein UlaG (beta-lactamase superfamily)
MQVRFLGWVGLELHAGDSSLVIDPLADPSAIPIIGEWAAGETVAPAGGADAGLVTHLHGDHGDAATLTFALRPGAPVVCPEPGIGEGLETIAIAGAEKEFAEAPFEVRRVRPWESHEFGAFTVTAVPAVDGTGDPQVSWVVEAEGVRVFHGGDTMWHGHWWNIATRLGPIDWAFLPANGVLVDFPHRQPATSVPAVLTPEQAVEAARALQARRLVPIHYGTFAHERMYVEREDVPAAVTAAAAGRGVQVGVMTAGETAQVSAAAAV